MKTNYRFKLLIFTVFFMLAFFLTGCRERDGANNEQGMLYGQVPEFAGSLFMVKGKETERIIRADDSGRFAVNLPSGKYSLLKKEANSFVLIERDILIENNLSFKVVNTSLVPIPEVTAVSIRAVYSDSAIISWQTNIESDGYIEYGTSELYGKKTYIEPKLSKSHRLQLYGLMSDTKYHFRVIASRHGLDSAKSISKDYSFTTESQ